MAGPVQRWLGFAKLRDGNEALVAEGRDKHGDSAQRVCRLPPVQKPRGSFLPCRSLLAVGGYGAEDFADVVNQDGRGLNIGRALRAVEKVFLESVALRALQLSQEVLLHCPAVHRLCMIHARLPNFRPKWRVESVHRSKDCANNLSIVS
jgi:hypothetical protein